jgi:two-component system alkaline phosphatase synthesis response regulator PhoP
VSLRVLLVEDEPTLVLTLTDRLRAEGYDVAAAETGDEGFRLARDGSFDVVLLDVALPGKGGFDVLRDLRQQRVDTPVIMLTARGQVLDRVLGLKLGADDYLPKPFDMMELLARVEAVVRRRRAAPPNASGAFSFGDIRVDFRRAEVTRAGATVELSSLEFKLLRYFVEHRGEVIPRETLMEAVWDYENAPLSRTVDMHVAKLRRKLEEDPADPKFIITVHRVGYKFNA